CHCHSRRRECEEKTLKSSRNTSIVPIQHLALIKVL
ncbi:adherence factor, partial [Chlamydia suis MD56]